MPLALLQQLMSIGGTILSIFAKMWEAKHSPAMVLNAANQLHEDLKARERDVDAALQNPATTTEDHEKLLNSMRLSQSS